MGKDQAGKHKFEIENLTNELNEYLYGLEIPEGAQISGAKALRAKTAGDTNVADRAMKTWKAIEFVRAEYIKGPDLLRTAINYAVDGDIPLNHTAKVFQQMLVRDHDGAEVDAGVALEMFKSFELNVFRLLDLFPHLRSLLPNSCFFWQNITA